MNFQRHKTNLTISNVKVEKAIELLASKGYVPDKNKVYEFQTPVGKVRLTISKNIRYNVMEVRIVSKSALLPVNMVWGFIEDQMKAHENELQVAQED